MANSYYLYLDLRYTSCIVRIIEKIRVDKITGVQGALYTCGLSPQKGLQMRGQSRIRTGVYGFADHRLNHSSNRPAKHIANVANYPFIEKIFIVFLDLSQRNGVWSCAWLGSRPRRRWIPLGLPHAYPTSRFSLAFPR